MIKRVKRPAPCALIPFLKPALCALLPFLRPALCALLPSFANALQRSALCSSSFVSALCFAFFPCQRSALCSLSFVSALRFALFFLPALCALLPFLRQRSTLCSLLCASALRFALFPLSALCALLSSLCQRSALCSLSVASAVCYVITHTCVSVGSSSNMCCLIQMQLHCGWQADQHACRRRSEGLQQQRWMLLTVLCSDCCTGGM